MAAGITNPDNVALIFGVTGLVGRELAKKLVVESRWKTYGVARNLAHHDQEELGQDSNFRFISCDLLDPCQTSEKLSSLQDVTHVFWVTWASQFQLDSYECCDQNKTMLSNALNAILPTAKCLKHLSLQTGTKHYVSLNGPFNELLNSYYYTEESPRITLGNCNFYYELEDLLKERLLALNVSWSVHRPGLILGSSQRTVFNVMGCLCVYATVCKHLNLPFVFGGSNKCWEEVYVDGSDARLVAEQHIWASTNQSILTCTDHNGQAFNAVNGTSFTWKETWPALAKKFGFEKDSMVFSESFKFVDFMVDKGGVWEQIVVERGLRKTRMEDLANWAFLDTLFRCPLKIRANRDKVNRLGFKMTYSTVNSMLYWVDCMRHERLIP
ncbi:hypothetical protein Syun_000291 [Stephania yunnanensis]|uniref:PRISE-like Rossmann-fold domain-containing protein n=1 Tax=Stephania yunnanensis TaxID=152371 RepID=A0AAP0LBX4_9MAGN